MATWKDIIKDLLIITGSLIAGIAILVLLVWVFTMEDVYYCRNDDGSSYTITVNHTQSRSQHNNNNTRLAQKAVNDGCTLQ